MARAIDAENTMNKLLYGGAYISEELAEYIKQVFDEQPTIDPVKHGKWIGLEYDGYADGYPVWEVWECSECGNEIRTEEPPCFCCDCGARMDGD